MICAKRVFSCFKSLERWGNKITGAAGPFFIGLAVILIFIGTISFCECTQRSSKAFYSCATVDVIAPSLSFPIISIPVCLLIALNLHMHYFYAITVPPGFLEDPPRDPVNSFLWARKVRDKGKQRMLTGGVRWSAKGSKITPASTTRCWKCKSLRPEVSFQFLQVIPC